jgi:hypothetical protein
MKRARHLARWTVVITVLAAILAVAPSTSASTVATGAAAPAVTAAGATHTPRNCDRPGARARLRPGCVPGSSGGAARADYNGDGFTDLAIGVPYEDVGSTGDSGIVQVLWGSAGGFSGSRSIVIEEGDAHIPSLGLRASDLFGYAIAGGDFDGNGYADLAIGIPGNDLAGTDAGAVAVLYGSSVGLGGTGRTQVLTEQNVGWSAHAGDEFGASLVWGEFGRGTARDLAIGAPYAPWGSLQQAGLVFAVYGSSTGLSLPGQVLNRGFGALFSSDAEQRPHAGDRWGQVLLAHDFGGVSSQQELAVGAPSATIAGRRLGEVTVIYGNADGLKGGTQPSVDAVAELRSPPEWTTDGQQFGYSLAPYDATCDGRYDLNVGVPASSYGTGASDSGEVMVADRLSSGGLRTGMSLGFRFGPTRSRFGQAMVAGDFDGNGTSDLAVGTPDDSTLATDAGSVVVFYNCAEAPGNPKTTLRQGASDGLVGGSSEAYDFFGSRLSAWNFGNGPESDLAIGMPQEGIGATTDAGEIEILFGSPAGLVATNRELFDQNAFGLSVEAYDEFGWTIY